jgi:hypothetical protein
MAAASGNCWQPPIRTTCRAASASCCPRARVASMLYVGGVTLDEQHPAGLYGSPDGGKTWRRENGPSSSNYWCHSLVAHPDGLSAGRAGTGRRADRHLAPRRKRRMEATARRVAGRRQDRPHQPGDRALAPRYGLRAGGRPAGQRGAGRVSQPQRRRALAGGGRGPFRRRRPKLLQQHHRGASGRSRYGGLRAQRYPHQPRRRRHVAARQPLGCRGGQPPIRALRSARHPAARRQPDLCRQRWRRRRPARIWAKRGRCARGDWSTPCSTTSTWRPPTARSSAAARRTTGAWWPA